MVQPDGLDPTSETTHLEDSGFLLPSSSRQLASRTMSWCGRSWQRPSRSRPRIIFYSHDTMGLGHKRRNSLLAQTLAQSDLQANILMIMGIHEQANFSLPTGVDYLTLPALYKDSNGQYRARGLDVTLSDLIQLRARTILAAVQAFRPDVFIVDTVPRGAKGELDLTLQYLKQQTQTRCILGLRDILDDPATVKREWSQAHNQTAICKYYDAVWVYGDPTVCDLVQEYDLAPEVASRFRYVGYLDQCHRLVNPAAQNLLAELNLPSGKLVLCCVGGGQDGANLAEVFAQTDLPSEMNGVILTGPFMPQVDVYRLHQIASQCDRLRVLNFVGEPTQLLKQVDRVICMGGYNTTCEILSFAKPALIVPRVKPRQEQWIRAERLRQMGLIDVLLPDALTPGALGHWLRQPVAAPTHIRDCLDLNGLARLPMLLAEILERPAALSAQAS